MILLSKNSLVVGYVISLLAGVAFAYCHDLSTEICPVDFETSQAMLGGDTLHHKLDQLVCALNRALITWSSWTTSDYEAVWVFFIMRSTANCAINYFPLSVLIMLQRIRNHKKL
jgi:hypothetical protein